MKSGRIGLVENCKYTVAAAFTERVVRVSSTVSLKLILHSPILASIKNKNVIQINNLSKINSNSIFKYDTSFLDPYIMGEEVCRWLARNPKWRARKNREEYEDSVEEYFSNKLVIFTFTKRFS
jgi:hypothetical protein